MSVQINAEVNLLRAWVQTCAQSVDHNIEKVGRMSLLGKSISLPWPGLAVWLRVLLDAELLVVGRTTSGCVADRYVFGPAAGGGQSVVEGAVFR